MTSRLPPVVNRKMFLADVESFMPTTSAITLAHCTFVLHDVCTGSALGSTLFPHSISSITIYHGVCTDVHTISVQVHTAHLRLLCFLVYRRSALSSILVQYNIPHRNASTKIDKSIANHKLQWKGIVE